MAKIGHFFYRMLTFFWHFFIDTGHIYVPKWTFLGSTSRPHIGDLVMGFFLLWVPPFMTVDGPKMVHFGPKLAKHGRLINIPKWSKRDQNCQPRYFLSFGPHLLKMSIIGQNSMKKWPFFAIILPWMASYGSETSFLFLFARDDLAKVS